MTRYNEGDYSHEALVERGALIAEIERVYRCTTRLAGDHRVEDPREGHAGRIAVVSCWLYETPLCDQIAYAWVWPGDETEAIQTALLPGEMRKPSGDTARTAVMSVLAR